MESKIAGVLSLGGAAALLTIWWAFLFLAQPECLSSFQAAKDGLIYALSPSESETWFFIYTLISIAACIFCGLLFFFSKHKTVSMIITCLHSLAAVFIYSWSLVGIIALPLLLFNKVSKNV